MDYLNQAGILIDAGERKLIFRNKGNVQNRSEQIKTNSFLINTDHDVSIQPMQESKIIFNTPPNSSHPQLNKDLTVMDGVIDSNGLDKCAVVVLNISQQTIQLPKEHPWLNY